MFINQNKSDLPLETEETICLEEDEEILLIEDEAELTVNKAANQAWKILIVDDEPTVHQATELVLKGFTFENKPVNLISAYSAKEAIKVISQNPDLAFIFLDVVMETNDAGLKVVKYIREELKNKLVRIILRTGQPGEAPEESVIVDYDINDYKLKVDLNSYRLVTTTITTLRSYRDVINLEQRTETLNQALQDLQQAQIQILKSEKMAVLGQLTSGITHEINNPVNFITGNLKHAQAYIQDLMNLLDLYQETFPDPGEEIESEIENIDLNFLKDDLPKTIISMQEGSKRLRQISTSVKIFSYADTGKKVAFNIHDGIDSTVVILKHRLKSNDNRPEIKILKNYGDLPEIKCFPGQLNQVFMNLLANAIDALEEANQGISYEEIAANPNKITIQTEILPDGKSIAIRITDNGLGMTQEVQEKIFDHLFTTKEVGKGTGLGLSISHQIVEDKHQGKLSCCSQLGRGTEFLIVLPID